MKMVISLLIILGMFLLVGTKLISGASWSAYVLYENGTGVDNVNVTAVLANNNYVNSTLTNTNGFFNLTITDNKRVKLISSKEDYLTDTSQQVTKINTNEILPFNITLEPELLANVTGRVTNITGQGVENAIVSAIQRNSVIGSTLTDSNGDYSLVDLLDGTYFIRANATGYKIQTVRRVILLPNSTTEINFSLNRETTPPLILNVSSTLITSSEAVIIWQTNEGANSSVDYWKEGQTVLSSYSSALVSSHLMRLSSLSSSILYYYNVGSCDFAGNCNTSQTYNFTTLVQAGNGDNGNGGNGGGSGGGGGVLTSTTKFMGEGAIILIRVENEIHYITIIKITNTTVTINISSEPQQATLGIGEEKKFEVTGDDFYDILVKLNGIENNNANLTISYIHESILGQLFDIRLELEDRSIRDFERLVAIVTFENFGTEPTPVNLLFTILNENGEEVYSEDDSLVVETEEVLRKKFKGDLEKGKYTLILTTLYDIDVVDEFRQEFEITKRKVNWIWIGGGIVIGILIIALLLWLLKIKLKNKGEKLKKNKNEKK